MKDHIDIFSVTAELPRAVSAKAVHAPSVTRVEPLHPALSRSAIAEPVAVPLKPWTVRQ